MIERREMTRVERRKLFDAFGKMPVAAQQRLMDRLDASTAWDVMTLLIDDVEFGRATFDETLALLVRGRAS